jgi:hypothetical protein
VSSNFVSMKNMHNFFFSILQSRTFNKTSVVHGDHGHCPQSSIGGVFNALHVHLYKLGVHYLNSITRGVLDIQYISIPVVWHWLFI